jgi:hypothetical protein
MSRAGILIYLNGSVPREKQEVACLRHCEERGYHIDHLVFHAADALQIVRTGEASVIVAAYAPADEEGLAEEVQAAGGRLEQVRRPHRVRREIGKIVERLFGAGLTVAEISDVLEIDPTEVRGEILRRKLGRE